MIKASSAEYVGIIDERCIHFSSEWLEKLLSLAIQKGVGAVSPKLINENKLIHSCGIVLGIEGIAKHLFNGISDQTAVNYYYGWDSLNKGYSALPVGCIILNRKHFRSLGGFNENLNGQTAKFIDLCLKFKEAELRNVVVPEVVVTINKTNTYNNHHPDKELIPFDQDRNYILHRWKKWIDCDPTFNPNLTLYKGKPTVAKDPRFANCAPQQN